MRPIRRNVLLYVHVEGGYEVVNTIIVVVLLL